MRHFRRLLAKLSNLFSGERVERDLNRFINVATESEKNNGKVVQKVESMFLDPAISRP